MEYIIILTLQMQNRIETFIVAPIKLLRKARCEPCYFKMAFIIFLSQKTTAKQLAQLTFPSYSHLCRSKKGYPRKHSDPEAKDKVFTTSSRDHLFRYIYFFIFTVISIALLRILT